MNYHRIPDRDQQNEFTIYWDKGNNNLANYFTKTHPLSYHQSINSTYIQRFF